MPLPDEYLRKAIKATEDLLKRLPGDVRNDYELDHAIDEITDWLANHFHSFFPYESLPADHADSITEIENFFFDIEFDPYGVISWRSFLNELRAPLLRHIHTLYALNGEYRPADDPAQLQISFI